jgi:hypothetical protein
MQPTSNHPRLSGPLTPDSTAHSVGASSRMSNPKFPPPHSPNSNSTPAAGGRHQSIFRLGGGIYTAATRRQQASASARSAAPSPISGEAPPYQPQRELSSGDWLPFSCKVCCLPCLLYLCSGLRWNIHQFFIRKKIYSNRSWAMLFLLFTCFCCAICNIRLENLVIYAHRLVSCPRSCCSWVNHCW